MSPEMVNASMALVLGMTMVATALNGADPAQASKPETGLTSRLEFLEKPLLHRPAKLVYIFNSRWRQESATVTVQIPEGFTVVSGTPTGPA